MADSIPKRAGRSGRPWHRFCARMRLELPPVCAWCGQGIDLLLPVNSRMAWTLDHILPLSLYPELYLEPSNVQPMHRVCNSSKGSKVDAKHQPINHSRVW
jgi:5-methylcytosine-specific restriction endonuclease McrA